MCGICGVIQWTGEPVAEPVLRRMAASLRHRGPDHLEVSRPDAAVGFGHARLSVIDLSPVAHQPMTNDSRTVWIVYNGEIYNYQALRQELQAEGATFLSQSDTEVILRAYERWGSRCVERLDGMFAFAIWDAREQQVFCARDRTGKKPFFYYDGPALWAFASEIKALLAHPSIPDEVNVESLPHYLACGYVPAPETCYRGIRTLPPGHTLVLRRTSRQPAIEPYWQPPCEITRAPVSVEDATAQVRRLVIEAVEKRLVADVPLGAFLSGGIDSTIVVGVMSRLLGRQTKTFSIGFQDAPAFDETRYARLAAARFGTQHTEFIVKPQPVEILDTLVYHHDQPFGDSSAIPTFLLAKLTRQHVTVALNGDGGDELFAGYLRFAACLLAERMPRGMARGLHRLMRRVPGAWAVFPQIARFCEAAQSPAPERLFEWSSCFAHPEQILRSDLAAWADRARLLAATRAHVRTSAHGTLLGQLLYANFKEYLPSDLHVKMDRCSMAHGLETRSPLLDTALIEYVMRLPDHLKLRGWRTKVVLRLAFQDLLPPAIAARADVRRKQGFGVPVGLWFRGAWRDLVQEYLASPAARLSQYLEPEPVRRLIRAHLRGERDHTHRLWCLLTLEAWLRLRQRGAFRQPAESVEPAWHHA